MRRKRNYKKNLMPDSRFNSALITKLINHIMKKGKKSVAQKIVYQAMNEIEKITKKSPLDIFEEAIKKVSPMLEVKSRRIGGANYQVPREVRGDRKITLAMRWIISASVKKKGQPMYKKLADELILASKNAGSAIKKREDTQRMAEANRAFAHFSW